MGVHVCQLGTVMNQYLQLGKKIAYNKKLSGLIITESQPDIVNEIGQVFSSFSLLLKKGQNPVVLPQQWIC